MQTTLVSLIRKARPVRALFTTFTFSIAWFEAIVIPALRASGCTQIDVLVDAREACKSTDDANSRYAGSAYRIIPVFMAGTTVFHPKLAYFEGEESDSLVIGSANLTLSGHGRNLEVLDAVDSITNPGVFEEFSEFLDALISVHDFSAENLEVLESYQRRSVLVSANAGAIDDASRKAWLIHTLERTAAEQLVEHAGRVRGAKRATILSPYHSPSGAPVANLARELGVQDVQIGVSSRDLTIPFRAAIDIAGKPVQYITANTPDSSRVLHAKCFEVEGDDGVIVMTGSVNATSQSFESTKNVEVSLVRLLAQSPFVWDAAVPVGYAPCEFNVAELTAKNPALQATWTACNHIVGLLQPAEKPQTVRLEIWDGEICHACIDDVALLANGQFTVKMSEMFNSRGALRLVLTGDAMSAVGWINVELELAANDTQRALAKASARMLSGDFDASDLAAIFSWIEGLHFSHSADASFETGGSATEKRQRADPASESPGAKLSYKEWRDSVEKYKGFGIRAEVARSSLEAAFSWLDRDVNNSGGSGNESSSATRVSVAAPFRAVGHQDDSNSGTTPSTRGLRLLTTAKSEFDDDDEGQDADVDDENSSFQRLVQSIPKALQLDASSAIVPLMVELSGSAVFKIALRHLQTIHAAHQSAPDAHLQLEAWLMRFSGFPYSETNRERLLPYFCAMACCTSHYFPRSSKAALKESLQRLAQGSVTGLEIHDNALLALSTPRFRRVGELDRAVIPACARAIHEAVTLSQQLEDLIVTTMSENKRAGTVTLGANGAIIDALREHRKSSDRAFGVVADRPGQGRHCPCCYNVLQTDDQARLRATRFFLCKNPCCTRPIFFGLDTAALARHGLAGRFKG